MCDCRSPSDALAPQRKKLSSGLARMLVWRCYYEDDTRLVGRGCVGVVLPGVLCRADGRRTGRRLAHCDDQTRRSFPHAQRQGNREVGRSRSGRPGDGHDRGLRVRSGRSGKPLDCGHMSTTAWCWHGSIRRSTRPRSIVPRRRSLRPGLICCRRGRNATRSSKSGSGPKASAPPKPSPTPIMTSPWPLSAWPRRTWRVGGGRPGERSRAAHRQDKPRLHDHQVALRRRDY